MPIYTSGLLIANTEWRQFDTNDLSRVDSIGSLLYERSYGSGTGYAEINTFWHDVSTITGSKTVDLWSLPTTLFGNPAIYSFSGGNVKAIQVANSGTGLLTVSLPFPNYSGIISVPTSGSLLLSSMFGWAVTTGNRNIILTHGGVSTYLISIIGKV